MKGIVIYKSKYGAAKQYAQWIAESLGILAVPADNIKAADLGAYDYVIAGSSIYIGKIMIKDWLEKNSDALKDKKLFFFIVGGAYPADKEKTAKYFTDNISPAMLGQGQCFYLQGKTIYKELSLMDKFLLKAGAWLAGDTKVKKEMLTDLNAIDRKNLEGLLAAVKKMSE